MPDADLTSPILLGKALRVLRARAGITQEQLADRLGADATFVPRLERGRQGAHWRTVARILIALDADLHDLADAFEEAKAKS